MSHLVTFKPKKTVSKSVSDYNNTISGVQLCDQEMSYFPKTTGEVLYQNFLAVFRSVVVEC